MVWSKPHAARTNKTTSTNRNWEVKAAGMNPKDPSLILAIGGFLDGVTHCQWGTGLQQAMSAYDVVAEEEGRDDIIDDATNLTSKRMNRRTTTTTGILQDKLDPSLMRSLQRNDNEVAQSRPSADSVSEMRMDHDSASFETTSDDDTFDEDDDESREMPLPTTTSLITNTRLSHYRGKAAAAIHHDKEEASDLEGDDDDEQDDWAPSWSSFGDDDTSFGDATSIDTALYEALSQEVLNENSRNGIFVVPSISKSQSSISLSSEETESDEDDDTDEEQEEGSLFSVSGHSRQVGSKDDHEAEGVEYDLRDYHPTPRWKKMLAATRMKGAMLQRSQRKVQSQSLHRHMEDTTSKNEGISPESKKDYRVNEDEELSSALKEEHAKIDASESMLREISSFVTKDGKDEPDGITDLSATVEDPISEVTKDVQADECEKGQIVQEDPIDQDPDTTLTGLFQKTLGISALFAESQLPRTSTVDVDKTTVDVHATGNDETVASEIIEDLHIMETQSKVLVSPEIEYAAKKQEHPSSSPWKRLLAATKVKSTLQKIKFPRRRKSIVADASLRKLTSQDSYARAAELPVALTRRLSDVSLLAPTPNESTDRTINDLCKEGDDTEQLGESKSTYSRWITMFPLLSKNTKVPKQEERVEGEGLFRDDISASIPAIETILSEAASMDEPKVVDPILSASSLDEDRKQSREAPCRHIQKAYSFKRKSTNISAANSSCITQIVNDKESQRAKNKAPDRIADDDKERHHGVREKTQRRRSKKAANSNVLSIPIPLTTRKPEWYKQVEHKSLRVVCKAIALGTTRAKMAKSSLSSRRNQ